MQRPFRKRTCALMIVTGLSVVLPAGAQVYKSTGESGEAVFSDTPPPSGPVERVEIDAPPPASDVERARAEVGEVNSALDELAAERQQKEAGKAAAKEEAKRQEVACAASQSRLAQLESQPPNRRLVVEPDGSSRRVSAEEMDRLIETARQQVRQDCPPE